MEFGLQCDYLLGQHCGGVGQLGNDPRHNVIQMFRRSTRPGHRGKWPSGNVEARGDVSERDRNEERLERKTGRTTGNTAGTNHDISANVKAGCDIGPLTFSDQL